MSADIRAQEAALSTLREERVRLINERLDSGITWDRVQAEAGVSRATVMSARRASRAASSA